MIPEDDEVIAEIRRIREAHAASFGYDLNRIVEDYQRLERESGRVVVTRPPKRIAPDSGSVAE